MFLDFIMTLTIISSLLLLISLLYYYYYYYYSYILFKTIIITIIINIIITIMTMMMMMIVIIMIIITIIFIIIISSNITGINLQLRTTKKSNKDLQGNNRNAFNIANGQTVILALLYTKRDALNSLVFTLIYVVCL